MKERLRLPRELDDWQFRTLTFGCREAKERLLSDEERQAYSVVIPSRGSSLFGSALDAEITLLHVVEPVVYPEFYSVDVLSDDLMERLVERSERALRTAADGLLGENTVRVVVEVGRAANTIVQTADPEQYDLVIMATRGLSGLEQVLLGSVAESVLRRCKVPMLAIPAGT